MIRQKLHALHLNVILEAMDLKAILVINIGIFLLCSGKECMVMQPAHITHRFTHLNLTR